MRRLPEPVDLATHASFRLNEGTLHSWDVRVAADQQATLAPEAVKDLLDVVPRLMSRLGKPSPTLSGRNLIVGVPISATATQGVTVTGPLDLDTVEVGGQRDVQPLSRTDRRRATRGGFSVRCGSR